MPDGNPALEQGSAEVKERTRVSSKRHEGTSTAETPRNSASDAYRTSETARHRRRSPERGDRSRERGTGRDKTTSALSRRDLERRTVMTVDIEDLKRARRAERAESQATGDRSREHRTGRDNKTTPAPRSEGRSSKTPESSSQTSRRDLFGRPIISSEELQDPDNPRVRHAKKHGKSIAVVDRSEYVRFKGPKKESNEEEGEDMSTKLTSMVNDVVGKFKGKGKEKTTGDNNSGGVEGRASDRNRQDEVPEEKWDYPRNGFPDEPKRPSKGDPRKEAAGVALSSRNNGVYLARNPTQETLPPLYTSVATLPVYDETLSDVTPRTRTGRRSEKPSRDDGKKK
ncbi:hypothetical protein ACMFMF_005856 [Clarireedia jacksonii]